MYSRLKLTSILIVLACLVSAKKKFKAKHGPSGMSFNDSTNCTEFAKFGRFNPFSVLHEKWFVFYYWASVRPLTTYIFTAPTANHTKHLKKLLDGNCILPVMWQARQILMEDNDGYISLLVERSDRGEYWLYPVGRVKAGQKITPRDVRLKQTGDNRILGLMDCLDESLIVMSRLNDVPRKGHLHEAAARLGYRGRKGRSYLYQGHEWGPVGEADEEIYWDRRTKKDTPKEWKSAEESSEEVDYLPINKLKKNKSKVRTSKIASPPVDVDGEKCIKVEPELWNDPKPKPKPDNLRITKEQLNDMDINPTAAMEPVIDPSNSIQENNLDTEITKENEKPVNHQEVIEMKMPINEANDLDSHTENSDPDSENCCFQSIVGYMPTYIPDRTSLNLKNGEEEQNTEVPGTDIPQDKVLRSNTSLTEGMSEEITRPEVPFAEVSDTQVPGTAEPISEKPLDHAVHLGDPHGKDTGTETPLGETTGDAVPRSEVPNVQITSTDAPRPKLPSAKTPRVEVPQAKVTVHPAVPSQDLTNSSGIIILTPKTLDDIKI